LILYSSSRNSDLGRNGSLIGLGNLYGEIIKLSDPTSSQTDIAMHNAGNDSYCTLIAFVLFMKLYSPDEITFDIQLDPI
jgi:hypothetical protein